MYYIHKSHNTFNTKCLEMMEEKCTLVAMGLKTLLQLVGDLLGISSPKRPRRSPRVRRVRKAVFSVSRVGWSEADVHQAKQKLTQMTRDLARTHGFEYNKLFIRNQKTKRGTCSSRRNLSLNIKLANAPDWIIEYVICHELAHLIHMNHSRAFWDEVGKIYPRRREAKQWLKVHGGSLMKARSLMSSEER